MNEPPSISADPIRDFLLAGLGSVLLARDIRVLNRRGMDLGNTLGKAELFLGTPFKELFAAFSPDGRWLAYQSETARKCTRRRSAYLMATGEN